MDKQGPSVHSPGNYIQYPGQIIMEKKYLNHFAVEKKLTKYYKINYMSIKLQKNSFKIVLMILIFACQMLLFQLLTSAHKNVLQLSKNY